MDEADVANDRAELDLQRALRVRRQSGPEADPDGLCLFCRQPTGGAGRWCDTDCRDAWERRR